MKSEIFVTIAQGIRPCEAIIFPNFVKKIYGFLGPKTPTSSDEGKIWHGRADRVLMLYRIRNGLVAIPASMYLQPTVVHTRGFETSYRQIQCNTSVYNQTFFPSAIRLWNTLPVDVCQLPPDSFKAQLNTIQLM